MAERAVLQCRVPAGHPWLQGTGSTDDPLHELRPQDETILQGHRQRHGHAGGTEYVSVYVGWFSVSLLCIYLSIREAMHGLCTWTGVHKRTWRLKSAVIATEMGASSINHLLNLISFMQPMVNGWRKYSALKKYSAPMLKLTKRGIKKSFWNVS